MSFMSESSLASGLICAYAAKWGHAEDEQTEETIGDALALEVLGARDQRSV